jgi:hypothetical protein
MTLPHFLLLWVGSATAQAPPPGRTLPIGGLGVNMSFLALGANFIGSLVLLMIVLCTILFLVGALLLILSRGKEDQVSRGKNLMIGSLIGLAIVLGSYAIISTFLYFLYVA